MGFKLKIAFVWYCLASLLVVYISGNEVTASFDILRDKHDTFQNRECQKSRNCTKEQCETYGANCADDECKRCQCKDGKNTFLTHTSNCTADEMVVPESAPMTMKSFTLKTRDQNLCLTIQGKKKDEIVATNCSSSSLNMRWIWPWVKKTGKAPLMNIMTLQCLEFLTNEDVCTTTNRNQTGQVAMKQCKDIDEQYIFTTGTYIYGDLCGIGKKYNLQLNQQHNDSHYPVQSQRRPKRITEWTNQGLYLRQVKSNYAGCYRFQNEKFMLYLDNDTCRKNPCSYNLSAPIFFDNNTECSIEWSKSNILRNCAWWQKLTDREKNGNFEIERHSHDIQTLKVYQQAFEAFNGSLLKLAITCGNEQHCLLLKFKSTQNKRTSNYVPDTTTTQTPKTTPPPPPQPTTTVGAVKPSEATTTATTATTTNSKSEKKDEGEKSSTNTIIIVVPVSIFAVILVLTLVCFIYYRKQKRAKQLPDVSANLNNPGYSSKHTVYADPNQMYDTPASLEQQQATPGAYDYIDNQDIAKPKEPQSELNYDYATNTEIPRTNLNTPPKAEQPEQKYDYATNTEIPRINLNTQAKSDSEAGQPELKYDYATNTEIPRINLNTLPKTEEDSEMIKNSLPDSKGNAGQPELKYDYATNTEIPRINLNNLPKSEVDSGQPELKYDYATNTEIPRINLSNLPKSEGDPVDPSTNPAYHTLEESNPTPHYSTLEEPGDQQKSGENGDRKYVNNLPKSQNDGIDPSTNPAYHNLEEPNPTAHYSTLEEPGDQPKSAENGDKTYVNNLPESEGDAVDPSINPTYHTLEEPNPPPYYSTLEDETKPLVTYDTPHSEKPEQ